MNVSKNVNYSDPYVNMDTMLKDENVISISSIIEICKICLNYFNKTEYLLGSIT